MRTKLYPFTFKPVYKNYPWGGIRIPETYQRNEPEGIYAESWEISDRNDGMSVISNGEAGGKTLHEILQESPKEIMGACVQGSRFPLLIKLIDAREKLSVQVHPDDETSVRFGGEAKTEMWYLLGENKAQVYCGLKKDITKEGLLKTVSNGFCSDMLRTIPVQKESALLVCGGRVHAIDAGCLILEIQQNSNTTYRLYDWGRTDRDGNPRELHIAQAMNVINWEDCENPLVEPEVITDTDTFRFTRVLSCKYFQLEKLSFTTGLKILMSGRTFHALFVSEGEAAIGWDSEWLSLSAGTSVLIPAVLKDYSLEGNATVLRTCLPLIEDQPPV